MTETRITTIRQPVEQADEVEFAARVDGVPVSEFIREAIAAHLEGRRSDGCARRSPRSRPRSRRVRRAAIQSSAGTSRQERDRHMPRQVPTRARARAM